MGRVPSIEIDIFGLIFLFVIYKYTSNRPEKHLFEHKLFSRIIYLNSILLSLNIIILILEGTSGKAARVTLVVMTTAYYVLSILPCVVWTIYIHFQVHRDEKRTAKLLRVLLGIALAGIILSIAGGINGLLFYYDSKNMFFRGRLYMLTDIICTGYLLWAYTYVIMKRKLVDSKLYFAILFFIVPPILAEVLQVLINGLSIMWVCTVISVFVIFMNMQNNELFTDHLTGLYNRRKLDYYLYSIRRKKRRKKILAGIMIDLNSFKQINDRWGHGIGDDALIDVAEILKRSFDRNDMVCRYGGDEFIVIIEVNRKADLLSAINRIKLNTNEIKNRKKSCYNLSFSIGYDIYDFSSGKSVEDFIKHIDNLMYKDKRSAQ